MFMDQIQNQFRRPLPPVMQMPDIQFGTPGPNMALQPKPQQQQQGGGMMDQIMKLLGGSSQGGQGGGMDLARIAAMFMGG